MRDYDVSVSARMEPRDTWEPVTDHDHWKVCENEHICKRAYLRISNMPTSIAHQMLKCSECEWFADSGRDV